MFSFKFASAQQLKNYINLFSTTLDEPTIEATPEGITLTSMDPARVSMFDVEFPKAIFESYQCDKPTKFSIILIDLLKVLKLSAETDYVEFAFDETVNKLFVTLHGEVATREFKITVMGPDEPQKSPKVTFTASVTLPVSQLYRLMCDAQAVSDHVRIIANLDGGLEFDAQGDTLGVHDTVVADKLIRFECQEPTKATFSVSYLSEVLKAWLPFASNVTMKWKTDFPIRFEFELVHSGKVWFYFAPRIEAD